MNLTLEQKRFYTLRIEFILDPKDSGVLVYFDVRSFYVLTTVERGTLSPFLFAFFLFFRGWGWIFPWIMVQESNNELRLILIFVFKELVFWPFTRGSSQIGCPKQLWQDSQKWKKKSGPKRIRNQDLSSVIQRQWSYQPTIMQNIFFFFHFYCFYKHNADLLT